MPTLTPRQPRRPIAWLGGFAAAALLGVLLVLLSTSRPEGQGGPEDAEAAKRLRVLTYNVLYAQDPDPQRWQALFRILENSRADVICLQEVEHSFLYALHQQDWFQGVYQQPQWQGFHAFPNGNYICARFPVERVQAVTHESQQRRRSLVVHLRVHGAPLAVATCHLESPLAAGALRAGQLRDVFAALGPEGDALLAGDLNFGAGEQPEANCLDARFRDLWTELRPGEPGFTWDQEQNPMAREGAFVGEQSRRLDRILWRSAVWQPESVELIGAGPLDAAGTRFPSDHFGVLGVLRRRGGGAGGRPK